MRILRHDHDLSPCGSMKSARPQILLQEEVAQNGPTGPADALEDDDIVEYARALGINAKNDPDLLWIAREGLQAVLPSDWRAIEDQPSGQIYYFNVDTGQAAWEHPLDDHYRQVVDQERQKRLRKTCIEDPALVAADVDGSPGRPKSPYASVFRQPSPNSPFGPRLERATLRPRGVASPTNSRSPTGNNLATPPPWAKTTLTGRPPTPPLTRTPTASPQESRKSSSVNSDGLVMKSPDSSSVPFTRTSSPNATLTEHTLVDVLKPGGSPPVPPRASGSFQDEKLQIIDRKLSVDKKPPINPSPPTPSPSPSVPAAVPVLTPVAAPIPAPAVPAKKEPSVQPISLEVLKEEEMRIKLANDLALQKIREQLAKEKLEEEARIRAKMAEDLKIMRDKMAKEKELGEKDLRQKAADELKRVRDLLQKERESHERSIREAVQNDLKKLKDQLDVERTTQERALRVEVTEKLKETELEVAARKERQAKEDEAQLKELEELRRSMQKEIMELQETHKRRVDEVRKSHETELEEIEKNLAKLRRELEKLEMQVADESAIKKTQIEALERQKASLEKHLSDLRQQELDIRAQCGNLNDELNQLTKDSKLNERAMARLEQQRTDMEEDLYMLKRAKQRYVDRVEQLKLVVGDCLSPLPSDLEDLPNTKKSESETPVEPDETTLEQPATPVIEVAVPPLENGIIPPSPGPIDSDDLTSNPSRPLTPEQTSSRAASPAAFFRRHSRHGGGGDQSAGTTNGSSVTVFSTNPWLANMSNTAPVVFDAWLLTCDDVRMTNQAINPVIPCDLAYAGLVSRVVMLPVALLYGVELPWLTSVVHYKQTVSPSTGCIWKPRHPLSGHDLDRSERMSTPTIMPAVSSCLSPDCGPVKIANSTKLLNEALTQCTTFDPNIYALKQQLAGIKDWMSRRQAHNSNSHRTTQTPVPDAQTFVVIDNDNDSNATSLTPMDAPSEDDDPGYPWIPDSSIKPDSAALEVDL